MKAEDRLCKYNSRKCSNIRTTKRNGELHSLCEEHREKACANQRRSQLKRRASLRKFDIVPNESPFQVSIDKQILTDMSSIIRYNVIKTANDTVKVHPDGAEFNNAEIMFLNYCF